VHDGAGKKIGAIWKPSQVPKGTLSLQTNKTKENIWISDRKPLCLEKYHWTLKGIYSIVHGKEKHQFSSGQMFHICYNLCWANGTMTDGCVPIKLICLPFMWNITETLIQNVKELLSEIESNWKLLGKCGNSCMYLPELWSKMSMKNVREQVMALLDPFVKNHVSGRYKLLTYYRVGAIHLKGEETQLECVGSLHRDYHNNVNNCVPKESPMSIILELDSFYFLYKKNCVGG
jgi:hypothetical protein